jgi:DNA-binding MarR family transcriptional regulator
MTQTETKIGTNEADRTADEAVARLRVVLARLGRQLRTTQAGAGLTPTQISVLFSVARRGPLRLSELAEIEGLNPTMLSRVIAQLTDGELVRRAVDPSDRRAAVVDATARGRRLREKIHRARNKVLSRELDGLSPAARESIAAALPALEALAEQLGSRSR